MELAPEPNETDAHDDRRVVTVTCAVSFKARSTAKRRPRSARTPCFPRVSLPSLSPCEQLALQGPLDSASRGWRCALAETAPRQVKR